MELTSVFCIVLFVVGCCMRECHAAAMHGGKDLTKVQETLMQDYRTQVDRMLRDVSSGQDFMRIFVPAEDINTVFVAMVNETVQKKKRGRLMTDHVETVYFDPDVGVEAYAAWAEHGASVGCSVPKPLLLDMMAELNIARSIGDYMYPSCTRVLRCAGSGCCSSESQECGSVPGTRVNVTRLFVRFTVNIADDGTATRRGQFLNYTLYEDTACECRDKPGVKVDCTPTPCPHNQKFSVATCDCKCKKRCPEPYLQDPESCQCRCEPKDRQCLKIKRGRAELNLEQCRCVGFGCEVPECRRSWHFSTQTCRCAENRAPPPPGRARMLNDVLAPHSDPDLDIELGVDPASGTGSIPTSTERNTMFSPTPGEAVAAAVGTDTTTPSTAGDLAGIPLPTGQRYDGHGDYDSVEHDTAYYRPDDHNASSTAQPAATNHDPATAVMTQQYVDPQVGRRDEDSTSTADGTGSRTTSRAVLRNEYSDHHHHSNPGFEDDEDVAVTEVGEGGSGLAPVDEED